MFHFGTKEEKCEKVVATVEKIILTEKCEEPSLGTMKSCKTWLKDSRLYKVGYPPALVCTCRRDCSTV